jgi:hypothetical protein
MDTLYGKKEHKHETESGAANERICYRFAGHPCNKVTAAGAGVDFYSASLPKISRAEL